MIDACLFVFLADLVFGMQSPTFPLFAASTGASYGLIGLLTALVGFTRIAMAIPVGVLSDRIGRPTVMTCGVACFAASYVIYGWLPDPAWLAPARVLHGLGSVATFGMGVAYLGDVIEPRDRTAAVGLYTGAMGTGFAVGPLIGALLAARLGFAASYQIAAAAGAAVTVVTWLRLRHRGATRTERFSLRQTVAQLPTNLRHSDLRLAALANLLIQVSVGGSILTFFPIYAAQSGISTTAIGALLAARAFVSALGRVPAGLVATLLPARWLLVGTLALEGAANLGLWRAGSIAEMAVLLVIEGLAFGLFASASMGAVATESSNAGRGGAMGFYGMAGSLGETVGTPGLGLVAELLGTGVVYVTTALVIGAGIVPSAALAMRGRSLANTRAPQVDPVRP